MNVGTGSNSRHGGAKRQKGNSLALEIANQHFSFPAIWMERNIHGVLVIEAKPVMRPTLTDGACRQRASEL